MDTGVLVVAHRGASGDAAEHTLAAYQAAIAAGADGLECDVRLTADGRPVCLHDWRVDRTSDGHGEVGRLTLADLDRMDFGSWHGGPAARPERGVLTLDRLLALAADAPRPVAVSIETKHPARNGGHVEAAVAAAVRRHGLHRRLDPAGRPLVRVMSFSRRALRRLQAIAPELSTVLLLQHVGAELTARLLPPWVDAVGPSIRLLRTPTGAAAVAEWRAGGRPVHVWTVDDPADVRRCLDAGVEAVITNRPAEVLALLGRGTTG